MSIVPNLSECQPRFVLYCRAHGLSEGDTWKTWEFMSWIDSMVRDYKHARGIRDTQPIFDHDDFTHWIENVV